MPVTAKLSKLFYDRLGEPIANELVEWFNSVDADYRGQLRELNEMNFARFDAKLEQRVAESTSKLEVTIEKRFGAFELKFEKRLAELELNLGTRISELETKLGTRISELETKLGTRMAELETKLERRLGEQTRWFFVAWATMMVTMVGLWARK